MHLVMDYASIAFLANMPWVVHFIVEQRKRQIAVKNVPPNVTEETMRSLFPEAQKITLNMEDLPDGGRKVG